MADEEYEAAFDVFELLATLVHLVRVDSTYVPVGRLSWSRAAAPTVVRFINEGRMAVSAWPVLTELLDGDRERFVAAVRKIDDSFQRAPLCTCDGRARRLPSQAYTRGRTSGWLPGGPRP